MENPYPAITHLARLQHDHKPKIEAVKGKFLEKEYYPLVRFRLRGKDHLIYVDDEYNDLEVGNPLLDLCLVLRALENYLDAEDYLVWCNQHGLDAANPDARAYHMGLDEVVKQISKWIDPIDSFVSDFDFELNAGAAQELRRTNTNHKK